MKTVYAACLARLGLSQPEAAELHSVRLDTVKSWSQGRRTVPQGAWDELRAYETQIVDAAEGIRGSWENAGSPAIEIDDSEADGIALMAAADFILSSEGSVHIGQTDATRAARQARRPN